MVCNAIDIRECNVLDGLSASKVFEPESEKQYTSALPYKPQ